jgi:hypothetical protein
MTTALMVLLASENPEKLQKEQQTRIVLVLWHNWIVQPQQNWLLPAVARESRETLKKVRNAPGRSL